MSGELGITGLPFAHPVCVTGHAGTRASGFCHVGSAGLRNQQEERPSPWEFCSSVMYAFASCSLTAGCEDTELGIRDHGILRFCVPSSHVVTVATRGAQACCTKEGKAASAGLQGSVWRPWVTLACFHDNCKRTCPGNLISEGHV